MKRLWRQKTDTHAEGTAAHGVAQLLHLVLRCHTASGSLERVPSKYPRIGVVRDPDLDRALRASAPVLDASSDAGRLRELALRGAAGLGESARAAEDRELQDRYGIRPAPGPRRLEAPPGRADGAATEALRWARGER